MRVGWGGWVCCGRPQSEDGPLHPGTCHTDRPTNLVFLLDEGQVGFGDDEAFLELGDLDRLLADALIKERHERGRKVCVGAARQGV